MGFARCQYLSGLFKVINDGLKHRIAVFYNNGCVEPLLLNFGMCSSNGKASWFGILFEPSKEQPIALFFTPITIVTHIKHHIKMSLEKLIDDSKNRLLNIWIMWRTYAVNLFYYELIGGAAAKWRFVFKRDRIMNAKFCLKDIVPLWRQHDIIMGLIVNTIKRKLNHNETIVPVIPLRSHSSAIRFSALRFISSERLNRAKASSYVIFLVPIFTHYYI